MNRRGFITEISIGLSALVFTPRLIQASWKQLPVQKLWTPHWAFLSDRWFRARQVAFHTERGYPLSELLLQAPSFNRGNDPVFLRHSFYEEMYPVVKAASGIIVEPFEHMPANWKPSCDL